MLSKDIEDNKAIGKYGCEAILQKIDGEGLVRVLTHCNTGSLATAGYGTALERVYCTETRPYNQGARLTAYELVHEKIPSTLIVDSMVAALMRSRKISAVVVGADRHHDVPFYVAAPFTSVDYSLPSGERIKIEERPEREMTHIGEHRIAAPGINCWNPSFDLTPASLITGIITEKGVFPPDRIKEHFAKENK
ncbi:hypothetical protein MSG28_002733 [Choristoneura fumiferana]|uniref:Uncharacterized protein n=1 Tax=Choristoneura fumiferana TaxID=7141 RepID=A0ACC0JJ40_CHOFU|nr:hypothetical protein MSG28_002733 [Choristoneura fumiferana]